LASLICIGPVTSATVRELGYAVAAEAMEYTVRGLTQALLDHVALQESVHA
jgi:uroporphyrinogen-III synthase